MRFNLIVTAAVLGLGSSMMAYADIDPNLIIGGEFVDYSDPIASTTVAVYTKIDTPKGPRGALCTGTIVAQDLVVTAGHCLSGPPANMRVIFGTTLKSATAVVGVTNYVRHPNYGRTANNRDQNDIGLLQIAGSLPDGYVPANLLNYPSAITDGATVVLAGYGESVAPSQANLNGSADTGSGALRKTGVTIRDANYGRSEVLFDNSQGHGACHGDSGGPAFIEHNGQYYLFGVTSRGVIVQGAPDECSTDVIYTNVLAQMNFMRAAAQALRQASQQSTPEMLASQ